MGIGGLGGSSVATANVGPGSFAKPASALPAGRQKHGTGRYTRTLTTGVVESPYGTHRITGSFRKQSLTPTSLHRIVRDTVKDFPLIREHQNRVNLERLAKLYELERTARLGQGDAPVRVRMWVSASVGTIEDLEGHKFDLDGPTDLAPVSMSVRRVEGDVLEVQDVNLKAMRLFEENHGVKHSLCDWFERIVDRGIPMLDEGDIPIDPGKLRRMHNRTHLEELYHMRLDSVVVNVRDVDTIVRDTVDLSLIRTIGDLPVGASLSMWALVDLENGHIDRIVYPETRFDEMKYGIAQFTVDMRDTDMLVVSWQGSQTDLAVKELDRSILPEFKRQDVIVYKPSDNSLRLDQQGSLRTPSQWLDEVPDESGRSETQRPTTALSELSLNQHRQETAGDFAMEASGMGPSGIKDWW